MMKKYELVPITPGSYDFPEHVRRYRIKALIDIPIHNVSVGDIGGIVQNEENLSQEGDCWIEKDARVLNSAKVSENALIRGYSKIRDLAQVSGSARVKDALVFNTAEVSGFTLIEGSVVMGGFSSLVIGGSSVVSGNAVILGHARIQDDGLITDKRHILSGTGIPSGDYTFYKANNPDGHLIRIGCWKGTIDDLQKIALSNNISKWPEAHTMQQIYERVPILLGLADMCEGLIKTW